MSVSSSTDPLAVSWKFRLLWSSLFLHCSTVESKLNGSFPRIVNGSPVSNPTTVSFFARPARDEFHYTADSLCGSTLIHSDILVTAAHCHGAFHHGVLMLDTSSNDSFSHKMLIDRQVRHPQWDYYGDNNEGALNYDVLLMRLESPIPSDDPIVQPIAFNADPSIPSIGEELTVYGFGRTEAGSISQELRQATVQYISNDDCTKRFHQNGLNIPPVAEEFICTAQPVDATIDISTCEGDSGGPVTVELATTDDTTTFQAKNMLVGVVSAGIGCSTDQFPNGHVRISSVASWIRQEICRLSHNPPDNCEQQEIKPVDSIPILLSITFDFFPQETLYAIRSISDQSIVHTGPEVVADRNSQVNTTLYLIPGQYTMEVYDTYGNGMMGRDNTPADQTVGGWELFVTSEKNDTALKLVGKGDGNFTRRQVTEFEVMVVNMCSLEYHPCQTRLDCCQNFYCINDLCVRGSEHGTHIGTKKDIRLGGDRGGNSERDSFPSGSHHV
jgi:Trypsin